MLDVLQIVKNTQVVLMKTSVSIANIHAAVQGERRYRV